MYLQVHPFKIATDVLSGIAALFLFAAHHLLPGIAISLVFPILGAFLVLRYGDLDRIATSRVGKYVKYNMTPSAQIRRLLGYVALCVAAWFHVPLVAVFGVALIIHAWIEGPLSRIR